MLLKEKKGSELRLIRDNNNNRWTTELIQTSQPKTFAIKSYYDE